MQRLKNVTRWTLCPALMASGYAFIVLGLLGIPNPLMKFCTEENHGYLENSIGAVMTGFFGSFYAVFTCCGCFGRYGPKEM